MGIKDIDINKDGVTLGDHIENMKKNQYIFGISAFCGSLYFFRKTFRSSFPRINMTSSKCPVMNILKTCDLLTGADAAFDDRSFFDYHMMPALSFFEIIPY